MPDVSVYLRLMDILLIFLYVADFYVKPTSVKHNPTKTQRQTPVYQNIMWHQDADIKNKCGSMETRLNPCPTSTPVHTLCVCVCVFQTILPQCSAPRKWSSCSQLDIKLK